LVRRASAEFIADTAFSWRRWAADSVFRALPKAMRQFSMRWETASDACTAAPWDTAADAMWAVEAFTHPMALVRFPTKRPLVSSSGRRKRDWVSRAF
jgi:hypothetical protein